MGCTDPQGEHVLSNCGSDYQASLGQPRQCCEAQPGSNTRSGVEGTEGLHLYAARDLSGPERAADQLPSARCQGYEMLRASLMKEPIHIISLGAGVQSSCMALMAAAGEITPMPVAAIFADTQAEPKSVYVWLDWLEKQLPFPVHRVTAGNLADHSITLRYSKKLPEISTFEGPSPHL